MKLYYATSTCSLSPHIVALELGLKPTPVKTDIRKKVLENGESFLKVNPKGQVPTLQLDNGEILTEGVAIVQYLASLVPGNKLMPEGFAKFKQLELLNFVATEVHKTYSGLFDPTASDEAKNNIRAKLQTKFAHLEPALTKGQFLQGNDFTCADAYFFTTCTWAAYCKVELPKFVQDYMGRVSQRPAVDAAMRAEGLKQ